MLQKCGHAKAIALHSIQALVLNFVSPVPYYSRLRLLLLTQCGLLKTVTFIGGTQVSQKTKQPKFFYSFLH